jgi:hypothetical protein
MTMRISPALVAAVVAALLAACGDDGGGDPIDATLAIDGPYTGPPACGLARLYRSDQELECGLGPPGEPPPVCRWQLEFGKTAASSFEWSHSDVVESGTFTCVGGRLIARSAGGASIEAQFAEGSPSLTWAGVAYTEVLAIDAGAP